MKTRLLLPLLLALAVFTNTYAQNSRPNILEVQTVKKGVVAVDMNDRNCIHVVDGLITSYQETVPQQQLAHFEQATSQEKLERLGFGDSRQCVMVKSSADLDIENYIYRQVHDQVQQIGTKYKIPIVVNEQLIASYAERRSQLSKLQPQQIKNIKFLDKAAAQAKYGNKIVFGLIEVTV